MVVYLPAFIRRKYLVVILTIGYYFGLILNPPLQLRYGAFGC
jgi:hypothetical protein